MMKISKILLFGLAVALMVSCNNNDGLMNTDVVQNPNTADGDTKLEGLPKIEFEENVHDFGKVIQGEVVSYGFKFRNAGGSPLVISGVNSSCGCTVSEYPEDPVRPGEEAFLSVKFDSEGRTGPQNKTVTVVSNTQPNTTKLRIKAQVIMPEKF